MKILLLVLSVTLLGLGGCDDMPYRDQGDGYHHDRDHGDDGNYQRGGDDQGGRRGEHDD